MENKEFYQNLFKQYVGGQQTDDLLKMLDRTDFYTAPASVKYHCNFEGGLLQHTLNVYDSLIRLIEMKDMITPTQKFGLLEKVREGKEITDTEKKELDEIIKKLLNSNKVDFASVVKVSLGHDFHKINFYKKYLKNVKDDSGNWRQETAWGYRDDPFVLGEDGTNSWYIMNTVMPLNFEEISAIENHMGSGRSGQWLPGASGCWKKSNLATLLHLADMYATFVIED